jgi:signal transduction histidine kinase/serine/threonine protein kinase
MASQFDILEIFCQGTLHEILRAKRREDDAIVLLKFYRQNQSKTSAFELLQREYLILQNIHAPCIATPLEIIEVDGQPVLVLENIEGESIKTILERSTPTFSMILQTCILLAKSVGIIHKSQIINNNLEPSNIFVNFKDDALKIIDFSFSSNLSTPANKEINIHSPGKNFLYTSPELTQITNYPLDYRSDIYLLGLIFYEMAVGKPPFAATNTHDMIFQQLAIVPIPPHVHNQQIPYSLSQIIMKCLEKRPADRYHNCVQLQRELESCLLKDEKSPLWVNFKLEPNQIIGEFPYNDRLYDLDPITEQLHQAFERVLEKGFGAVFIEGLPGVGKTQASLSLRTPTFLNGGHFIHGRCSRERQLHPYSGLGQAFNEIVHQILALPENRIRFWREKISDALNRNGQILIEIAPEFEILLGPQPPLVELDPYSTKKRIHATLFAFLKSCAGKTHPLVIFLNNAEWIDHTSAEFLEFIFASMDLNCLLFVLTFNTLEGIARSSLFLTAQKAKSQDYTPTFINIQFLKPTAIESMINDLFHLPPEDRASLTNFLAAKTNGNPFHVDELLRQLSHTEVIDYNIETQEYKFSETLLKAQDTPVGIADFFKKKIIKLSEEIQKLLKVLTILSCPIPLDELKIYADLSEITLRKCLRKSANLSLTIEIVDYSKSQNPWISFVHDLIPSTIYKLMTSTERKRICYEIVKRAIEQIPQNKSNPYFLARLFMEVDDETLSNSEKTTIANFLLETGSEAIRVCGFTEATPFIARARKIVKSNPSAFDPFDLIRCDKQLLLCLLMRTKEKGIADILNQLLNEIEDSSVKESFYTLKFSIALFTQNYKQIKETEKESLHHLGYEIKNNYSLLDSLWRLMHLFFLMKFSRNNSLFTTQEPSERILDVESIVIKGAIFSDYNTGDIYKILDSVTRMALSSFKRGATPSTPIAFDLLGSIIGGYFQAPQTGLQIGLFSQKIQKQAFQKPNPINNDLIFYINAHRWSGLPKERYEQINIFYMEAQKIADLESIRISLTMFHSMLDAGFPLVQMLKEVDMCMEQLRAFKMVGELYFLLNLRKYCVKLQTGNTHDQVTESYIKKYKHFFDKIERSPVVYNFWSHVLEFCYSVLVEDSLVQQKDLAEAVLKHPCLKTRDGMAERFDFYYGLYLLDFYEKYGYFSTWVNILKVLFSLKKLAKMTSFHKAHYLIIKGRKAQVRKKTKDALELYNEALRIASAENFIIEKVFLFRFLAKIYASLNDPPLENYCFRQLNQEFLNWGAHFLSQKLLLKNPHFQQADQSAKSIVTLFQSPLGQPGAIGTELFTHLSPIEMQMIAMSLQTLSNTLDSKELTNTFLAIVSNNIYFEKIVLILNQDNNLIIQGIKDSENHKRDLSNVPITKIEDELSIAIIHDVAKNRSPVFLSDTIHKSNYENDPHILHKKPRMLICLPLICASDLKGLLYLENQNTSHSLSSFQLSFLHLICHQMSICMKNSEYCVAIEDKETRLAQELEQKNSESNEQKKKIKEMQNLLLAREKMATLGFIAAGISHELKNPLNFVINISEGGLDIAREAKELILQPSIDPDTLKTCINDTYDCFEKILEHGRRADKIIKNMLVNSRQEVPTNPEEVPINELLTNSLKLTYKSFRNRNLKFECKLVENYVPCNPTIVGFPGELLRVFINIFDNAFYALQEKKIASNAQYSPSLQVSTQIEDMQARILISDNATGIPESLIKKIFNPFFTTKPPGSGTGLGLSIVHDIIFNLHKGDIQIESKEGEGTTFIIRLPLSRKF